MGTNDSRSGWNRNQTGSTTDRPLPRFVRASAAIIPLNGDAIASQNPAQQEAGATDTTSELAQARIRRREMDAARRPSTNAFVGKFD